jgi:hypothetical protein
MAQKKTSEPQTRSNKRPAEKSLSFGKVLPVDDVTFEVLKLNEISELLWLPRA